MTLNIELLREKGLVQDYSDLELFKKLPAGSTFYVGFDPTASSLQLGNLVPLILSIHLAKAGYQPILLFGGATGLIGDPSGKSKERPLLAPEVVHENIQRQMQQASSIFKRCGLNDLRFVNNLDWTKDVSILDFLREVGKHFTVNYMLAKDSVKNRLEDGGISFTEFSYMLLQSFDYLHLYQNYNCRLQIGGSDQWGNITSGLELIRKKIAGEAYALSIPLLTNAHGKKFGKSEGGAIWLDADLTPPYQLYQYLLNVGDTDAIKYLKLFSFSPASDLNEITRQANAEPEKRITQHLLAKELCTLIHGDEATQEAIKSSEALFSGDLENFTPDKIRSMFSAAPSTDISAAKLSEFTYVDLLSSSGIVSSKGEARRLISGGGAYFNEKRIEDPAQKVPTLTAGQVIVLRSGKKKYLLVDVI
jgi:tyrosyl-tRNA synthetase